VSKTKSGSKPIATACCADSEDIRSSCKLELASTTKRKELCTPERNKGEMYKKNKREMKKKYIKRSASHRNYKRGAKVD
jgi:hypothetical protein